MDDLIPVEHKNETPLRSLSVRPWGEAVLEPARGPRTFMAAQPATRAARDRADAVAPLLAAVALLAAAAVVVLLLRWLP